MIGLGHYLVLSAVLFAIGLYGVLTRRNAIAVFMSLELMFNAVNVAAIAFSRYVLPAALAANPAASGAVQSLLTGQIFAVFIITVAAAEVALGLGIVMALYRNRGTADVTEINLMKH